MWHLISVVLLLCFLSVQTLPAQAIDDSPEAVSLYSRGRRLMRQGDWLAAARTFEELSGRFPSSRNIDIFQFNRSKAEYYFGNYDQALAGFTGFAKRFSESPHRAHALYFAGNIQYLRNRGDDAFSSWVKAYALSSDSRLDNLLTRAITEMIESAAVIYLRPSDFSAIEPVRRCTLIKKVVNLLLERNEDKLAARLLESCGEELPEDRRSSQRRSSGPLEIAVVLPFSGELETFAENIYNGAVIGADLSREENKSEIKLSVYDTEGDPVKAARLVRELVASEATVVLGPLTSEESAVASAVLSCADLPLLFPAATQSGLTLLGQNCFQLSPNMELQAVRMAEYAAMNLQADSAAIITSTSSDNLAMSRAFAKRFGELGGTVIAIEYYRTRDKDFGKAIRDIKSILLGLPNDSAVLISPEGDTLHPDEVSVSIDCLYLPGEPNQLRQLLPQIRFYSVSGAYLGSDGWGNDKVYRLGDHITLNAVFPSPFLYMGKGEEFDRFSRAYDIRYGKAPDRLAALGYDAVRIIAQASVSGKLTREELATRLASTSQFQGASARITFGKNKENIEMPIYRIINGIAVPVGDDITPDESTTPQIDQNN